MIWNILSQSVVIWNPRLIVIKITSVKPAERYFSITWKITVKCNFDCMYCPHEWHDNHGSNHDLGSLQRAWRSILSKTQKLDLRYKICFTGGEVTTNRHFLPFVIWLRENFDDNIFSLVLTTNGSASIKYYQRLYEYIDNISFSLHSEHVNEQQFFDKILALSKNTRPDRFLHVNIMDEFWNQDRILIYQRLLDAHGISHSVNQINLDLKTRSYPIMKGALNLDV